MIFYIYGVVAAVPQHLNTEIPNTEIPEKL